MKIPEEGNVSLFNETFGKNRVSKLYRLRDS